MTEPLSPAAQAVLDAFENASDGEYVEGVWVVNERTMLAAALRAAANQVVPEDYRPQRTAYYPEAQAFVDGKEYRNEDVRDQLLAIAAELDQPTP